MTNLYDKANELERALRADENYKTVEGAFEAVKENAESDKLYKEFISVQEEFMTLMNKGEQPSEEKTTKFQELQAKLLADEKVNNLIQAQQRLQITLDDINKIIYKPLEELFNKYEK
ncbi:MULTISPECIES: YlbF family regulator [unclassified Gemella]|uniref:YlbF family regulator n=1 Tax=unclassified Gemella TaxID=2624949 RepID=UPI001C057497|nr:MULTISPECIES: YlbF family regulator [unclassified Gemella]MBU0279027.1 YlbF family regulator [Gemella sp. zg-1178]QWQ39099.1 YlbF family regulator [Gemella sp. zg-570]